MKQKRNLVLGISPNGYGVSFTPKNNVGSIPTIPTIAVVSGVRLVPRYVS
jgi:hypothetical protein